jgi:predicted MFS family arabinose efflux permease
MNGMYVSFVPVRSSNALRCSSRNLAILVMSIGMTLAVAPLTSTVLSAVERHQTGMASGLNSALSRLGGLIVVALLGAVLAKSGKAMLEPFSTALIVMAIAAVLGGVAAFFGLTGKWKRNPDPTD